MDWKRLIFGATSTGADETMGGNLHGDDGDDKWDEEAGTVAPAGGGDNGDDGEEVGSAILIGDLDVAYLS